MYYEIINGYKVICPGKAACTKISVMRLGLNYVYILFELTSLAVAYRRESWGVQTLPPPLPKFRSFDKAAFDCKLSGKCLVFLFQHPN